MENEDQNANKTVINQSIPESSQIQDSSEHTLSSKLESATVDGSSEKGLKLVLAVGVFLMLASIALVITVIFW